MHAEPHFRVGFCPKRLQEHAKARNVAELYTQLHLVNFLTGSSDKLSEHPQQSTTRSNTDAVKSAYNEKNFSRLE